MASKQLCSWWRGFKLFKEIVTQVWWKLNSKHINSFSALWFPYATQKKMSNLMSIIAAAVKWTVLHLFIVKVVLCLSVMKARSLIFFFIIKYSLLARDQEIAIWNCFLKISDLISATFTILVNVLAEIYVCVGNYMYELQCKYTGIISELLLGETGLLSSVLNMVARHKNMKMWVWD